MRDTARKMSKNLREGRGSERDANAKNVHYLHKVRKTFFKKRYQTTCNNHIERKLFHNREKYTTNKAHYSSKEKAILQERNVKTAIIAIGKREKSLT